ncbi:hypothetical protein K438DRAFT_261318 [Mycena galopus ATCC 62051]|nr:hypothetical protein K438DRAFT_261318 [Mycena galopus ATCC 62051]
MVATFAEPQTEPNELQILDLTPRDTNPIEDSHAHDNQVNKTNAILLEAILSSSQYITNFECHLSIGCYSACQFDEENTRIIKASLESGIWENGNNPIHARFSSQAARQLRSRQKKANVTRIQQPKGFDLF